MKKRSIGILLLSLTVCTCISGCSSQSIADVNEKSIQAEEETETEYAKKDVVIKKPEDSTKPLTGRKNTFIVKRTGSTVIKGKSVIVKE